LIDTKKYRISLYFWICVSIAICILIFYFSSQNGETSGNVSQGVTKKLFPSATSDNVIFLLEKIMRKIAHYAVYFVLGSSVYLSCFYYMRIHSSKKCSVAKSFLIPVAMCFIYSCTDELHQSFIPGRNGSFFDCLLDTLGALSGILFAMLIRFFLSKTIDNN